MFYGCNVAAGDAGAEFVERLYELTGAQIAASATKTGNAKLGGDWLLQVRSGETGGAELAFEPEVRDDYEGVLATINVDQFLDENDNSITDGDISLRDAIRTAATDLSRDRSGVPRKSPALTSEGTYRILKSHWKGYDAQYTTTTTTNLIPTGS